MIFTIKLDCTTVLLPVFAGSYNSQSGHVQLDRLFLDGTYVIVIPWPGGICLIYMPSDTYHFSVLTKTYIGPFGPLSHVI